MDAAARNLIGSLAAFAISFTHAPCLADKAPTSLAACVQPLVRDFMSGQPDGATVLIPAMSVAIGRDGTLLYADGFGEARPHQPATARSIYMVGSITKQFTAAAVLRLMEKGAVAKRSGARLSPTMPVADVLKVADAWAIEGGPPITVGDLLSMTSNLPNFTRKPPPRLDPWGAVPAHKLLRQMRAYRPSGYPGSFEYSNTSYFLLSEIIEAVKIGQASRDYHQTLRDEVFTRLGLTDTGFESDRSIRRRLVSPNYHRRPRFEKPDWLQGSADVASSVIDLFKWDKALMEGKALTNHGRDLMLSDSARVEVWTYYGMGWFITHKDGIDRYFHSGTVSGYTSFNLIVRPVPDHWVSVSLLTNSDGVEGIDEFANSLASLVLDNDPP
jgi:CubicO group peptidase (beta-lactamase class C family)